MEYAVRITRSYKDLELLITDWAQVSERVVVYQHDPDAEVKKTHVHILIQGCSLGTSAGLVKRALKHVPLKGNQDWSFRPEEYENDPDKYITYMTKGNLQSVYNKGYTPEYLEERRVLWKDFTKPSAEICVQKEPQTKPPAKDTLSDLYQTYCDEILENVSTMGLHLTIRDFRSASIAFWRKRNGGLLPQTSTYKRFITSVFLEYRDLKRLPLCEETLNEIELKYA